MGWRQASCGELFWGDGVVAFLVSCLSSPPLFLPPRPLSLFFLFLFFSCCDMTGQIWDFLLYLIFLPLLTLFSFSFFFSFVSTDGYIFFMYVVDIVPSSPPTQCFFAVSRGRRKASKQRLGLINKRGEYQRVYGMKRMRRVYVWKVHSRWGTMGTIRAK